MPILGYVLAKRCDVWRWKQNTSMANQILFDDYEQKSYVEVVLELDPHWFEERRKA